MLKSMTLLSSIAGDAHPTVVTSAVKTHLPNPLTLKGTLHGTFVYSSFDGVFENGTGSLAGIGHVTFSGEGGGIFEPSFSFTISSTKLGSLSIQFPHNYSRYIIVGATGSFAGKTGSGPFKLVNHNNSSKEVLKFG
jgi:hypothetical protein